jgi:hypothetical protein
MILMDLIELRLLAVGGILAVGLVVSTLAVSAVAVAGWIGRVFQSRVRRVSRGAVGPNPGLGAGGVRC